MTATVEELPTMRLVRLTQTEQAPAEWEGRTEFGEVFYARCSHGRLSWGFGRTLEEAMDKAIAAPSLRCGRDRDSSLETDRMLELLRMGYRP